jgi:TatD DNase family protein
MSIAPTSPSTEAALLDTHCHLANYGTAIEVLTSAQGANVHVIAVSEDPGQYRTLRAKLGPRAGVTCAIGMHPLRAHTFTTADLTRFFRLLPQASWVGEIGLDFSRVGRDTRRQQLRVFDAVLSDPRLRSLPVTVHSRGAEKDTIARLTDAGTTAILHWYSGPLAHVDDALAAGLRFSINPAMTTTVKGRALIERLPADRILLETDGPFARHRHRPSQPADLLWIVEQLAAYWDLSSRQAITQIVNNQHRLLAELTNQILPPNTI